jgi:flagellar hook-basal body protein
MSDGIYIALSGAVGETNKLDIVSNNLANSATVGYQRLRPVFHEVLSQAGAAISGTTMLDTTRGAFRVTGRALDVSLPDSTYIAVGTSRGERYTRAGSIEVAPNGALTLSGCAVLGENGDDHPGRGGEPRWRDARTDEAGHFSGAEPTRT